MISRRQPLPVLLAQSPGLRLKLPLEALQKLLFPAPRVLRVPLGELLQDLHVGLAQPGSPKLINSLLENGYLPVVSSIGVTDEGQLMNVNADQAATALAATLGADLILLSDVSGILDGKGQRIAEMTAAKAEQLIEQGIITDGMIVKVNAALDAARTLGRPVDIASWRHAEQLPALFNGMPMGTRILA